MITNDVFDFINTDRYSGALQKGVTFTTSAYVYDQCNNLPNDLTGFQPRFIIKETFASVEPMLECTIENGRIELESTEGIINVLISAIETESLPVGMFVYEFTITSDDDLVFRLAFGKFQIMP